MAGRSECFYQCLPYSVARWQEGRWFAAGCLHCLWDANTKGRVRLVQALYQLGSEATISESVGHRLESLLDLAWEGDGYMLTKLGRMIKLVQSKGIAIDCEDLLGDLIYWNADSQNVQRKMGPWIVWKTRSGRDREERRITMLYEIHMLKNYPPVNLNRDDSGAPKSCIFGGVARGRVSSQCLKRSWRTSPLLAEAVGAENLGARTRKLPELVAAKLADMGVSQSTSTSLLPKLEWVWQ